MAKITFNYVSTDRGRVLIPLLDGITIPGVVAVNLNTSVGEIATATITINLENGLVIEDAPKITRP